MTGNLGARVTALETASGGDLRAMTDEELRDLAGPRDPIIEAALARLSDAELRAIAEAPNTPAGQAALTHLDHELLQLLYPGPLPG